MKNSTQGAFSAPYGSEYDTRYTEITQLDAQNTIDADNALDLLEIDVSALDVIDAAENARPESETPEWSPKKQTFQFTADVGVMLSRSIPFKAQSLRIDNLTNQWLFIQPLRIYIPPDWFCAIISTVGLSAVVVDWQAPPGLTQAAPTAATIATFIAHSERLTDVAGIKRL